jgi:hypothetical protein
VAFGVLIFLCILATAENRPFLPQDPSLLPVGADDRNRKLVDDEIARITNTGDSNPVGNTLEAAGKLDDQAVRTLFPKWDFYAFRYSNYLKKGFEHAAVHLAGGLGHTVAVERKTGAILRLDHYGNHEAYGDLLKRAGAVLRGPEDVQRIWDAFCVIHRKAWKGDAALKMAGGEWRLGITSYDQTVSEVDGVRTIVKRTHYFQVVTETGSGAVSSWKSVVETSDRRTEGVEPVPLMR